MAASSQNRCSQMPAVARFKKFKADRKKVANSCALCDQAFGVFRCRVTVSRPAEQSRAFGGFDADALQVEPKRRLRTPVSDHLPGHLLPVRVRQ